MERPVAQVFTEIVSLLADPSREIREKAAAYLKVGAITDEVTLSALFPFFDYASLPASEQSETEDLWVRVQAVKSVYFEHGSKVLQEKLLSIFDRPGLGIKKALTKAFKFCPDQVGLKDAMLERTTDSCPENALSAWYVLGVLNSQELRPRFHQLLQHENAFHAQAGAFGLYPLLAEGDIPHLQRCQQRWRPEGLTI